MQNSTSSATASGPRASTSSASESATRTCPRPTRSSTPWTAPPAIPSITATPSTTAWDELREAIAAWYARRFQVDLDPATEIVPLIGSKEGIAHLPLALVNPGDTVLMTDPGYPVYAIGTMLAGGVSHSLPLTAERGWIPDLDAVPADALANARLLWLCYPGNPTAAVAPFEFFEEAVEFARANNLVLAQDAAYSEVVFDGYRCRSILEIPEARDVAVEFHSLSKTYNMTGWRVGWMAGHAEVVEALGRVKTNVDSGIFQAVQHASITALDIEQDWIDARNAHLQDRRDRVVRALRDLGRGARGSQGQLVRLESHAGRYVLG